MTIFSAELNQRQIFSELIQSPSGWRLTDFYVKSCLSAVCLTFCWSDSVMRVLIDWMVLYLTEFMFHWLTD